MKGDILWEFWGENDMIIPDYKKSVTVRWESELLHLENFFVLSLKKSFKSPSNVFHLSSYLDKFIASSFPMLFKYKQFIFTRTIGTVYTIYEGFFNMMISFFVLYLCHYFNITKNITLKNYVSHCSQKL